jgi:hypothetical protein
MIMRKQKGVTLSGLLIWAVALVFLALLGLKVAPAYFEYLTIQKEFKEIASDPSLAGGQRTAIERAFYNRTTIDNVTSVTPQDLDISKDGDGLVISAAYSVRVPLFANVSLAIDFRPSSAK